MRYLKGRRLIAFTLAEVLVALSIVGCIAIITLPTLVTNIRTALRFHAVTALTRKFTKSIALMRSVDKLTPYTSTADFVKELQNFMRIAKVCDKDHITECWPYESIKLRDGSYYNITNIQSTTGGVLFNMKKPNGNNIDPNDNPANFETDVVAIQIADGTSAIIAYNTLCDPEDKAIENCYVALFEINGKSAPNTIGQDAILINAKKFATDTLRDATDPAESTGISGAKERSENKFYFECTGDTCSRIPVRTNYQF